MKPESPEGKFDTETGLWLLTHEFFAYLPAGMLDVKPGFESDGASIPRLLWAFVGPKYSCDTFAAAFAHDALYASELTTRAQADYAFMLILRACGVGVVKARAYWLAVRVCGWAVWKKHTPDSIAKARAFVDVLLLQA